MSLAELRRPETELVVVVRQLVTQLWGRTLLLLLTKEHESYAQGEEERQPKTTAQTRHIT